MIEQPFDRITAVPTPGPWHYVELRDGRAVPQRFVAETEAIRLEIEIDLTTRRPRAISLEIRAPEGGHLTSGDLRVPVARLVRQAVAGAVQAVPEGMVDQRTLLAAILKKTRLQAEEDAAFYDAYTGDGRTPRQGSPITDKQLREVASHYRDALARSSAPTQTIADEMHVSRPTAARWIARARERGFLGPAYRGRAGEK